MFLFARDSGQLGLGNQIGISEALAEDSRCGPQEARGVIALPVIEPENLFVEVTEQMRRVYADIGSAQRPLQQAPEVLNGVGVNLSLHIAHRMVNDMVGEFIAKAAVGRQGIAINGRPLFHTIRTFTSSCVLRRCGT